MANRTNPLTKTEVKHAKPWAKEYNLADGGGLYLRVKPNSTKQWLFNYLRPFSRKRADIDFGQYPEVSLAEARRKREDARKLLARGIDPKEFRDEQIRRKQDAAEKTLARVFEEWFKLKETKVTQAYAEDVRRCCQLIAEMYNSLA